MVRKTRALLVSLWVALCSFVLLICVVSLVVGVRGGNRGSGFFRVYITLFKWEGSMFVL